MDVRDLITLARDFGFPAVVALLLLLKLDRTLKHVADELHQLRVTIVQLAARLHD